ncbi:MFS transporter [Streptococcus cristatus]|uniref:MFS transporter n=1 Tax=Streptococcus cristatus TaxID=45634 RepID=A0A5B0DBW8_STRCR|nr:MFS transporter [Streptococcus cristatus]KAA0964127.1 MFS transporter [Streptococcus cristatus]
MKNKGFQLFLLIWLGSFISQIGSGMTSFALGIYTYQLTGQVTASALVTLSAFLPGLLASPLAGTLADRHDRRLLMALGDGLSGLGVAWIYFILKNPQPTLALICLGACISSLFSALVEPAFRATISDLLPEEQLAQATGLTQINGVARYLISPLLAGLILTKSSISTILLLDISTIFVTVATTLIARQSMQAPIYSSKSHFWDEFFTGFRIIHEKKGIWILVLTGTAFSFFLGTVQILLSPLILSFADAETVGWSMTVSSSGMLVGGLALGALAIKKGFHRMLCLALFALGIFMAGMGLQENIIWICSFGFFLFAALPFANTAIDYLVRININKADQGKAWGTIGIISQLGYVISYASMGWIADHIFKPLLTPTGSLATSLGKILGTGNGRGYGLLFILSGISISIGAYLLSRARSVKELEYVSTLDKK